MEMRNIGELGGGVRITRDCCGEGSLVCYDDIHRRVATTAFLHSQILGMGAYTLGCALLSSQRWKEEVSQEEGQVQVQKHSADAG